MQEVQYADNGDIAIFNGKSFRRDKRTGYYLAGSARDGGRRKRLHVYVWEYHNGTIPEGYQVHHIDHNKSNNEIDNLQILTNSEHQSLHGREMSEEERERRRNNLIENAIPKAKEWHRSENGRKWHSQNAKKQWESKQATEYECTNCGKHFESRHRYSAKSNRFCCNACKAAYRRKSGIDDTEIKCRHCGNIYTCNKYHIKKCPKCHK